MKKIVFAVMSAVALMALSSCSKSNKVQKGEFTQEAGKLKIAMEVGYPPFEYYAEDGKTPAGFDVELGKEIANNSFKATYGSKFYDSLSKELIFNLPNIKGLSSRNLRYIENLLI